MSDAKSNRSRKECMTAAGVAAGLVALVSLLRGGKLANAQQLELNAIDPTPEQAAAFAQLPDRPVVIVNLLKFSKDGASANAQYSGYIGKILEKISVVRIFRVYSN